MHFPFILPVLVALVALAFYGWRQVGETKLDQEIALQAIPESSLAVAVEATPVVPDGKAMLERFADPIFTRASQGDPKKRHLALEGIGEKIAQLSVSELKALIKQDPDLTCAESRFLAKTPMREWVEANVVWPAVERLFQIAPIEALHAVEHAEAVQEGEDSSIDLHNLIRGALGTWSLQDMEAAWSWISARMGTLGMAELKRNLMLEAHAEHDFTGAIAMAERHDLLDDALSYIGRSLATEADMIAYLDASAKADPNQGMSKRYAAKMIVEKVHNTQGFQAAQAFLQKHVNDAPWVNQLVENVATTHLQEAPAEKAAWLIERLPTKEHPRVMSRFIQEWATLDLPAAGQWLGQQAAPWKGEAIAALVKTIEPVDPAAAEAWKASLVQP